MKQLLTLTLVALLGLATFGCNKTEKVNAAAVATLCVGSNCDLSNCDPTKCSKAAANCPLLGTPQCPLAAAKAAKTDAKVNPAAAGATKSCCSSKAKAKPAAAGAAKSCCSSKAKAKPAATSNNDASGCSKKRSGACPFSGK